MSSSYAYTKAWKERKSIEDPRFRLFESSRVSARNRGFEWKITIDDIVIPEYCPVLGYKLLPNGQKYNSPSVDRTDSTKGYVKGNVAVISRRANSLKSNGTVEEFEQLLAYMKKVI